MGVILSGYFKVPPAHLDAVRAALPLHVRLSRAETGCLCFDITEDAEEPGLFNVYEEFTDADALRAHRRRCDASDWAWVSRDIQRHYTVTGLSP
ncbi:antibiotic biosynthesis monooxygenase [Rhodovulum bhavnagarense]|uniref:Antibiotic biosynthesis monooxygenase n=1 Tax=Rhodovulum bhavnagarense TaxID=992286 RepID=A0A4R2RDH8_9RHOB|nr:putative quinol monooxygenase [Rhodovulum bhavnagarense]TCP60554.1 antibiotic biosynthesis monooxygenase [Rhodovulum bhavnagarense]